MRKFTLASLAIAGLALSMVSASAADLSRRPVYKAPPPVAQIYNWTGFYIGGHIGGAFGSEEVTGLPAGFTGKTDPDGFIGGAQAGYNWQSGNWVFGIEGDWSWSGADGSTVIGATPFTSDQNWLATATGRIGYAWDNWLWYAKGGAAWLSTDYGTPGFSLSDTRTGWTIGGGVEVGLAPNWSAKLEYNYMDFGSEGYVFPQGPATVDTQIHVVKAGLNYRFNWGY
ncbi:MAG: porin family protein [Pseudorhodoplanes sp.]|nr:porin family protein [Pseudorhodoplanes sp.]